MSGLGLRLAVTFLKGGIEEMKTKLILTMGVHAVTCFATSLQAADAPAKEAKQKASP